jgi:Ca2+-binding RTX toxin-like protein
VIRATLVGTNQLRLDVAHDGASAFQSLDADAARGVGWSVLGNGGQVTGTAVSLVDADTLVVTFSGAVAADGMLHYGYGYGRLGGADGSGRGNAVYDNAGLPIWVQATGLKVGTSVAPPDPEPDPRLPEPPKPDPKPGLVLTGTSGADELKGGSLGDSLSGGGGNDRLSGLGGADTLLGGEGRDTLLGGAGDDVLSGGAGNDALRGDGGNDLITTGAGVDRVLWGTGAGADRVSDFALGTDRVQLVGVAAEAVTAKLATVGGVAGLQLALGSGETLFLEGVGAATARQLGLSGSFAAGSVVPAPPGVINGTSGEDWLKGGTGADTLNGGAGSDDLQGLGGNDVLRGGAGDDGLTGGAGVDTFVFGRGDGADWVVDFQAGVEKVRLEGIGAGSVVQTLESRWGMAGLELDFGNGDEMFLQGVTAKLATSDFVFA